MTSQQVALPVRVSDNGVRSFIPPTFCFELHDRAGTLVSTVSRVVWTERNTEDFDAVALLRAGRVLAAGGHIDSYDAGPQAREPGFVFTFADTVADAG
ncbi:hypothetical protein OHA98_25235 [Streptomyces sp. NBC_00654]|uniref:hypothetical protein n=1 Tax=Streptomyces sp. NBC_00654 TaxID=2975799 RepID=UPI00224D6304|nr:hypothetical protein [Streptomyces sp. NBC_00654]MCX4968004.1 hypothetical protein [Streptomyces sp. NBC_00654]